MEYCPQKNENLSSVNWKKLNIEHYIIARQVQLTDKHGV